MITRTSWLSHLLNGRAVRRRRHRLALPAVDALEQRLNLSASSLGLDFDDDWFDDEDDNDDVYGDDDFYDDGVWLTVDEFEDDAWPDDEDDVYGDADFYDDGVWLAIAEPDDDLWFEVDDIDDLDDDDFEDDFWFDDDYEDEEEVWLIVDSSDDDFRFDDETEERYDDSTEFEIVTVLFDDDFIIVETTDFADPVFDDDDFEFVDEGTIVVETESTSVDSGDEPALADESSFDDAVGAGPDGEIDEAFSDSDLLFGSLLPTAETASEAGAETAEPDSLPSDESSSPSDSATEVVTGSEDDSVSQPRSLTRNSSSSPATEVAVVHPARETQNVDRDLYPGPGREARPAQPTVPDAAPATDIRAANDGSTRQALPAAGTPDAAGQQQTYSAFSAAEITTAGSLQINVAPLMRAGDAPVSLGAERLRLASHLVDQVTGSMDSGDSIPAEAEANTASNTAMITPAQVLVGGGLAASALGLRSFRVRRKNTRARQPHSGRPEGGSDSRPTD